MTALFKIGSRTSNDVAQAIFLLSSAKTAQATAEASYQVNLARLAAATGCMLGHAGVEWGDYADLGMLEKSQELPVPISGDLADEERSRPTCFAGEERGPPMLTVLTRTSSHVLRK